MVDDLRYKRLERAKASALNGDYKSAYSILDALHRKYPEDIEVHRLYGNVLELDAWACETTRPMDERLRSARKHYAHILRTNKHEPMAIFDLAEHFANLNKVSVARRFFAAFLMRYGNESALIEEVEHAQAWLEVHAIPAKVQPDS